MAHADESTVETAIQARLTSLDSGNYRANNKLILKRFAAYLREHRDITDLKDLDVIDCRRYAQWLRQRANDENDQLSAVSVHEGGPLLHYRPGVPQVVRRRRTDRYQPRVAESCEGGASRASR